MNRLERIIYNIVKDNTTLKHSVKKIYQSLFLIIKPKKVQCDYELIVAKGYFFGFHDKSPWSTNNSYILAHKIDDTFHDMPQKNNEIKLGYFTDKNLEEFITIGSTKCWNWQQGSMLQWLGNKELIIYNYWDGNKTISNIVDLQGEPVKTIPFPTGAASQNGRFIASYDFERLNIGMYGYGYANESVLIESTNTDIPKNSGFIIYDLENNITVSKSSIFSINEFLKERKLLGGYLFVTHFLFSPNNKRVLFLLRSYKKGRRLVSRMISCNIDGSDLHVFQTGNMVSHISWVNDDKVLAYCSDIIEKDGYYLFTDRCDDYQNIGKEYYSYDGHPQYSKANNSFITDSYPNRRRLQELSIYNFDSNIKSIIGRFYSPINYINELRCDLHPRWDREGKKICFDTTYTGQRTLCVVEIEKPTTNINIS